MNDIKELEKFQNHLYELATEVFEELGSGFKEDTLQQGLAIAFRQSSIKYLRETHLEIFYKKESLGLFRLDFLIPAQKNKKWKLNNPIVIETKTSTKLGTDARLQLKNYLISAPKNNPEELKSINEGFLLNWNNKLDPLNINDDLNKVELELWSLKRGNFKILFP